MGFKRLYNEDPHHAPAHPPMTGNKDPYNTRVLFSQTIAVNGIRSKNKFPPARISLDNCVYIWYGFYMGKKKLQTEEEEMLLLDLLERGGTPPELAEALEVSVPTIKEKIAELCRLENPHIAPKCSKTLRNR